MRKHAGLTYQSPTPFKAIEKTLGAALLVPTKIYVSCVLPLCQAGLLKGLVHITGGGLLENIPRILPPDLGVQLDASCWPLLPVFQWLKNAGNLSDDDLARTFQLRSWHGFGRRASAGCRCAARYGQCTGEAIYTIGEVVQRQSEAVQISNTAQAWH